MKEGLKPLTDKGKSRHKTNPQDEFNKLIISMLLSFQLE